MISTLNVLDEKGAPLEDITATNNFKWNQFTVLVGSNATHICKIAGDQLSVVLTIPMTTPDESASHPFAYYPSTESLAIIVAHKLIFLKTLESTFIKREDTTDASQSTPLQFISHFEFEYFVLDLFQLFPNTIPSQYALFFESSNLHLARLLPNVLIVDAIHVHKSNPSNILDNNAKLSISNISQIDASDLSTALSISNVTNIHSFFFNLSLNNDNEEDANDEWGFMKDFTGDSEDKQIDLFFLISTDNQYSCHAGTLFAGQFQLNKSSNAVESDFSPTLFRHFDIFSNSNLYIFGLNDKIIIYKQNEFITLDSPVPNLQLSQFSPNATFLILLTNENTYHSLEFSQIFKSESDISPRLKIALESKQWLDTIRFILYPITNHKQHALIPNRVYDTFKSITSYYPFKTILSSNPAPIQHEIMQLLLVITRDIPTLKLSFMNINFILQASSLFEFFYGCASDLTTLVPVLSELQFANETSEVQFETDALDFIAPQVVFLIDFMLYVVRDIQLFNQDKQQFETNPSHVLFVIHPALVKLMLQLIVLIRSIQVCLTKRQENKFKFLNSVTRGLNLKDLYDLFHKQKAALENLALTRDQELQLLVHATCPQQLLHYIPLDALKQNALVNSKQYLLNTGQWMPIQPPQLEDRILLFGGTCDLLIGEEWLWTAEKKAEMVGYLKTQVDVVRKCKLYKDSGFLQCLYCGRFSGTTRGNVIEEAFEESCFCGGEWINVNRHLDRIK